MSNIKKIRISSVTAKQETFDYRSPMKFGGRVVEHTTIETVTVEVVSEDGKKKATGIGSIPLGLSWAWPKCDLPSKLAAKFMKNFMASIYSAAAEFEPAHPIELGLNTIDAAYRIANEMQTQGKVQDEIPELAVMLACSALDAAVFDAFGRINECNSFKTLSSGFMDDDLSRWLGPEFVGKYVSDYLSNGPKQNLSLYHLVGGLDPLSEDDLAHRIHDGLPETLEEWIRSEGITHLKIKLDGANIDWDVGRVIEIDRIAARIHGENPWSYSLDFNEQCGSEDYVLEFLERIDRLSQAVVPRVQYIEQPTHRDIKSRKDITMHRVSRIKPIVIDESLTDLESIRFAKQQGFSGVALKTCKTMTESLLFAALATELKMFLCVQDLTCVGMSFIQSAALAAHLPSVNAVEGNGRQYCPLANYDYEAKYRPLFKVRRGSIPTELLGGVGLGCEVPPRRKRPTTKKTEIVDPRANWKVATKSNTRPTKKAVAKKKVIIRKATSAASAPVKTSAKASPSKTKPLAKQSNAKRLSEKETGKQSSPSQTASKKSNAGTSGSQKGASASKTPPPTRVKASKKALPEKKIAKKSTAKKSTAKKSTAKNTSGSKVANGKKTIKKSVAKKK